MNVPNTGVPCKPTGDLSIGELPHNARSTKTGALSRVTVRRWRNSPRSKRSPAAVRPRQTTSQPRKRASSRTDRDLEIDLGPIEDDRLLRKPFKHGPARGA